jgi:hypothetical protein
MKRNTNFLYLAAILILAAFFGYVLFAFNLKEGATENLKTFTIHPLKNGHYYIPKNEKSNITKYQLNLIQPILKKYNDDVDRFKKREITEKKLWASFESLSSKVSEIVGPELKN